jgi:hypothetical protein
MARSSLVGQPGRARYNNMKSRLAVGAPGATSNASGAGWLQSAVFALDRRIRDKLGVYEYTVHPECLFRLQLVHVEDRLVLADGTAVAPGSRALALHLWNERIPVMGPVGPTLAWARKIDRAIHASLHELACYLAGQPSLRDVAAICGDMPVRGIVQAKQLARIMARYGFEAAVGTADRRSLIHRFGDAVLVLMLVWATNPCAVRSALHRYCNIRLFVSRAALERRYISSMRAAHRA